jgi:hypothetical protein
MEHEMKADDVPAELLALRRERQLAETPFYADEDALGELAITLDEAPVGAHAYVGAIDGVAHERFFADVLWIGVDAGPGGMIGYWKGDADTFAGAPVIRLDNEENFGIVAARVVDYLADLMGEDAPGLVDFCRRAGLAPPGSAPERRAAIAGLPDPRAAWDRLVDAEHIRAKTLPLRPLGCSPLAVPWPAGVLVVSGYDPISWGYGSSVTLLFDPAEARFTALRPIPDGMQAALGGAGTLPDGRAAFMMYGGPRYCRMLDPQTRFWDAGAPSPVKHGGGGVAMLADGRILVAGGAAGLGRPTESCEIYDPSGDVWTVTGALATPRHRPSLVAIDGGALVVGGSRARDADPVVGCERFDAAAGRWSPAADLPLAIDTRTVLTLSDGVVLAVGRAGWALYDAGRDSWLRCAGLPVAERTAVRLDDARVALFGADSAVSVLDVTTGELTAAGHTRLPRADSTAVRLPDGSVLLLGGTLFGHLGKEPEIWRPATGESHPLPGLAEPLDRQVRNLAAVRRHHPDVEVTG